MIVQAISSLLFLIAIFIVEFNMAVTQMGLGANLNALLIVLGGTLSATLIAYPWGKVVFTAHLLKRSFAAQEEIDSTIRTVVELARLSRMTDIRTLEEQANKLPPGLLRIGVELIAFKCSREAIEQVLQREVLTAHNQYATSHKILYNMGRLAPALGLAGTVIYLIRIFGQITDPQHLIGYMGVALLCTFYGVILANICFVPLANKIKEFMAEDEVRMDVIQEGILDIYDREHPRAIQYKLETLTGAIMESEDKFVRRLKLVELPPYEKVREVNA